MNHRSLPIPPKADRATDGFEVLRVWIAEGGQHVSIAPDAWADPAAWGILLVDLARHIANACHVSGGPSRDEVLARIREGFDTEWSHPTDEPEGGPLG